MNKKKESKVVPNVRFKGFTDDWKQRKLGDVSEIIGGGTPSTNHPEYWDGDIDWYSPAEILDQIYVKRSRRRITQLGYDNSSAKLLPPGTVLFTSRAGIGKTAILSQKSCTNQGFQSIVPHENQLDTYFIFSRTNELKRYGELVGAGSTFAEVSGKQMSAMNLMLPTTIQEQQLIGQFFKKLDCLITLHQQKITRLIKLKKAMLEKMFPKKGSVIPEIRFNGFVNAWEQRKLGDVLERRIEQRQQSKEYPRLAFASGQGVIPLSERKTNNREQLTKDEYTKKYLVTELNDIVYNPANVKYGAIDRNKCGRGLISPIYVTFTTSEISGFIERIVTSHDFQQRALRFEEGTVTKRQSVNPEDLVTLDILVASKREEQQKIATYFDYLDNLITLHQRKIDKIKNMKKAMLDQMFIY